MSLRNRLRFVMAMQCVFCEAKLKRYINQINLTSQRVEGKLLINQVIDQSIEKY